MKGVKRIKRVCGVRGAPVSCGKGGRGDRRRRGGSAVSIRTPRCGVAGASARPGAVAVRDRGAARGAG